MKFQGAFQKVMLLLGALTLIFAFVACQSGGEPADSTEGAETSAETHAVTVAVTQADTYEDTAHVTQEVTHAVTEVLTQAADDATSEVGDATQEDTDTQVETQAVTEAEVVTQDEASDEEMTDAPAAETVAETQIETQEETISETQPETEADTHEPAPLTQVSFDRAAAILASQGKTANDLIGRVNKAKAEFVERDGETVLALVTDGVTQNVADPFVQLKYSVLAELLGELNVDIFQNPYMVLRVKDEGLWSHTFALRSYKSSNPSVNDGGLTGLQRAHLADTQDWQYISFDLSAAADAAITFRLVFENAANASGETLLISDIQFFQTKEEAEALAGNNTYELREQTAEDYTLKVMSFNVQTENGTAVRFDIRADMLRDILDEYQPDSIGLQEVTPTWRAAMDSYIFNDSYTGVGVARTNDASLGLEQSCIFYRSDKFELLDSGTFWLSDTPNVVGSSYEGSQYPRICTYVHLKDKATGLEYVHMNTHLHHKSGTDGNNIRKQQISVLLEKLYSLGDNVPVVVTGDFNQRSETSEGTVYALYKMMTGLSNVTFSDGSTHKFTNLADSRATAPVNTVINAPEGSTATMTKYYEEGGDSYNPQNLPIDYCFYTKNLLEAKSYSIELFCRDGVYMSDHLPVFVTFKFIPQA